MWSALPDASSALRYTSWSAAPPGLAAALILAVQYTTRSIVAPGQRAACSATSEAASERISSHRQPATPRPRSLRPA